MVKNCVDYSRPRPLSSLPPHHHHLLATRHTQHQTGGGDEAVVGTQDYSPQPGRTVGVVHVFVIVGGGGGRERVFNVALRRWGWGWVRVVARERLHKRVPVVDGGQGGAPRAVVVGGAALGRHGVRVEGRRPWFVGGARDRGRARATKRWKVCGEVVFACFTPLVLFPPLKQNVRARYFGRAHPSTKAVLSTHTRCLHTRRTRPECARENSRGPRLAKHTPCVALRPPSPRSPPWRRSWRVTPSVCIIWPQAAGRVGWTAAAGRPFWVPARGECVVCCVGTEPRPI